MILLLCTVIYLTVCVRTAVCLEHSELFKIEWNTLIYAKGHSP